MKSAQECVMEIANYASVNELKWMTDDLEVIAASIGKASAASETEEIATDIINNPDHYTIDGINATELMKATLGLEATREFFLASALKYIFRHTKKNGEQDLLKARRCMNIWYELGQDGTEH